MFQASEPQDSTDTPSTPDSIDSLETQPDTPPPPQESPMSELCSALRACRLSSERGGGRVRHPPPPRPNHVSMHNGDAMSPPTHLTSPHLYIDKSCQVRVNFKVLDKLSVPERIYAIFLPVKIASC